MLHRPAGLVLNGRMSNHHADSSEHPIFTTPLQRTIKMRRLLFVLFILFILVLGACGPAPALTPAVDSKNVAVTAPVGITVKTSAGSINITRTRLADQWPADCNPFASQTGAGGCTFKA